MMIVLKLWYIYRTQLSGNCQTGDFIFAVNEVGGLVDQLKDLVDRVVPLLQDRVFVLRRLEVYANLQLYPQSGRVCQCGKSRVFGSSCCKAALLRPPA